jgi:hypothetical protein
MTSTVGQFFMISLLLYAVINYLVHLITVFFGPVFLFSPFVFFYC